MLRFSSWSCSWWRRWTSSIGSSDLPVILVCSQLEDTQTHKTVWRWWSVFFSRNVIHTLLDWLIALNCEEHRYNNIVSDGCCNKYFIKNTFNYIVSQCFLFTSYQYIQLFPEIYLQQNPQIAEVWLHSIARIPITFIQIFTYCINVCVSSTHGIWQFSQKVTQTEQNLFNFVQIRSIFEFIYDNVAGCTTF